MRLARRWSRSATERGSTLLLVVTFLGIAMCGLTFVMMQDDRTADVEADRSDARSRALELAEMGLARASLEIQSMVDSAADGVGNLTGTYAGGTYTVTATQSGSEWTVVSTGRLPKAARRVEAGLRRVTGSGFGAAILAQGDVKMGGGGNSDSFDSRLGSYASQATNTDAWGTYASRGGGIGTNGSIDISGGALRGDAIPGVTGEVEIGGGGTVTGSTAPRSTPLVFQPTPQSEFQAALTTNNNGSWIHVSGGVDWDPATKELKVSSGEVIFPPGTYFFSTLSLTGGSIARFSGDTKIYIVEQFVGGGGGIVNTTGVASKVQIFGHPYAFPGIPYDTRLRMSLTGGTDAAFVLYAPWAEIVMGGGGHFYGAVVGNVVELTGGSSIHYDLALAGGAASGRPTVQQIHWRERTPPKP